MKKKVAKRKKLDRSGVRPAWWISERKAIVDAFADQLALLERQLEQKLRDTAAKCKADERKMDRLSALIREAEKVESKYWDSFAAIRGVGYRVDELERVVSAICQNHPGMESIAKALAFLEERRKWTEWPEELGRNPRSANAS